MPPFSASRAAQIGDDLASGDLARLRDAIAVSPDQPLETGAAAQLKALAPVTLDVATFHDNGDGSGTATAHVAHPAASRSNTWTVYLIFEDALWKLSFT